VHPFVSQNGNLLALDTVRLSPGQAGLLSGWGLFTTVRLYQGQPFAFERHWQRFQRDAARTHLPFDFSQGKVLADLLELARVNRAADAVARLYFIYNKFGFWQSNELAPVVDVLMYTADLPTHSEAAHLSIQPQGRHAASPLAGTKVTSWLQNVWSLEHARKRGYDEVILLNERDEVAECTAANIFVVKNGQIATPPLSSGCLAGVTRDILIELARDLSPPVAEQILQQDDLMQADEVFITSTTRHVQPVAQIEDRRLAHAPGAMTLRLAQAFSEYVQQYFARRVARSAS